MNLKEYIVDVPNWPKDGITFKDIPPPVISKEYELEYGTDTLEIKPGVGKVVIVDDVYATGGTAKAAKELVYEAGYDIVDEIFLINLKFLNQDRVKSVITYE